MKRPHNEAASSGRDRKRAKMRQAREIQVEPERRDNLTASTSALPANLNVDKFVQARAFELEAIERSMHTAKLAGNTRAFQSLPRHLRRRAASHNVQRLPLRLRHKARLEIMNDKLKHKKRKFRDIPWRKKRKLLHMTQRQILELRAKKNGWLETHVWQAKRMKMVEHWHHRVAKTPTEKSFRPSYRASQHGCLLHDASYYAVFQLKGKEEDLQAVLKQTCDPLALSPSAPRFLSGARIAKTTLYKQRSQDTIGWPNLMLAPVEVLWRPMNPGNSETAEDQEVKRVLWIIAHPSASADIEKTFKVMREVRGSRVQLQNLSQRVNMLQLSGPKASAILSSVLKPVPGLHPEKAAFLKHLASSSLASLPPNIVAAMTVHDPRLSFPPTMPSSSTARTTGPPPIPSVNLASQAWDGLARWTETPASPKFSKADLDKRRSEIGSESSTKRLSPTAEDDRVPVIIYKNTIGSSSPTSSPSQSIDSLTLIVPKHWAMPFLMSLAYCAPRLAGLDQVRQQHYEAGALAFPFDHPWTQPGSAESDSSASQKFEKWSRTPPAQRVNYKKLGTQSAFRPDFRYTRLASGEVVVRRNTQIVPPWRVSGLLLRRLLAAEDSKAVLEELDAQVRGTAQRSGPRTPVDLDRAVVTVSVTPVREGRDSKSEGGEGLPETNAALYEERRVKTSGDTSDWTKENEILHSESISGWVLQGGYSMSRGHGFGLGCVGFWAAKELFQSDNGALNKTATIFYKNPKARAARRALVQLIDT